MSDVLDNERGPAPLWVVPIAMLAVVAVVVALAWRWNDSAPSAAVPTAPSPSLSLTPSASPSLEQTLATTTAGNACGGDVTQPIIEPGPLPSDTKLRLLAGDRDLRLIDVDAGTSQVVTTRRDRRSFTQLVQTATRIVTVLRDPCTVGGYGEGFVASLDPTTGDARRLSSGDVIIPGEPPTVLDFNKDGTAAIRDISGTSATPIPTGWQVHARTSTGYFASLPGSGDIAPEIGVGSPASGRLTQEFGRGPVVAASPELLFWLAGDCPTVRCLLTWTTVEGTNTAQAIDTYGWGGSVSPDGMKMAFIKQRASGRAGEHPGPPSDIAVLQSGGRGEPIHVLPGLVLPAKASVTFAWSPDSVWLVIGVDLGSGATVLVWRDGMDRPAQVSLGPTGGGTTGPPSLLVLPR